MDINASESSLKAGSLFADRYAIQRLIGLGGMGEVYLALDTLLNNEPVALKIIHEELSKEERNVKRFQREIQLTRKIAHGNIARTFDAGVSGGRFYFSMEYLEGRVISDLVKEGVIPALEACRIIQQVCEGLDAIHKEGIVHRDMKPGNLILLANGTVKITDFGIARPGNSDLTKSSEVLGSAPYMAPELWTGTEVGSPSDIYALGALFYEMITGVLPLDGDTAAELMFKHLEVVPPRPSSIEAGIPLWLDTIVLNLLSKRPADRYKTGREIAQAIEHELTRAPLKERVEIEPEPAVEREQLRIINYTKLTPTVELEVKELIAPPAPAQKVEITKRKEYPLSLRVASRIAFAFAFVMIINSIERVLLAPYLNELLAAAQILEYRYLRVFVTVALIVATGMYVSTPLYLALAPMRTLAGSLAGYLTITTRMSIAVGIMLIANILSYLLHYGIDFTKGMGSELLIITQKVVASMGEIFLMAPISDMTAFTAEARELLVAIPAPWSLLIMLSVKFLFVISCPVCLNLWAKRMGYQVRLRIQLLLLTFLTIALCAETYLLMNGFITSKKLLSILDIGAIHIKVTAAQFAFALFNWAAIACVAIRCVWRRNKNPALVKP